MIGKLFIFEGPDGVGKTTLVKDASDFLRERNVSFLSLSSPGRIPGTLGHLVDTLHHDRDKFQIANITALGMQAMHIAAHLDAIESTIKPALDSGTSILLDRIWWSTWVYGKTANVNQAVLAKLIEAERLSWGDFTPAVIFLVQRAAAFRAEHSQEAFTALSILYEELAAREELRYPVVRIFNDDLQLSTYKVRESIASVLAISPPEEFPSSS